MVSINNQLGTTAQRNHLLEFDGIDEDESVGEDITETLPKDEDPEENDFINLTEDDILHGYLPDSNYNPMSMEEDGVYPQNLNWSYSDIVPGTPNTMYQHYNGPGPCLRKLMDWKFDTLLGACGIAGGFSHELLKRITMNSNANERARLVGHRFYGSDWKNITV